MDRGLEGHPRSVKLGSGDNKMRLYTSIRSKTPAIWRRGLHISSAGLVLFTGSKRRLLSHPDSSSAQAVLVIRLRGSGLSIYGPPLWAVPGSPHFYEVHGRGSFPAETDGNPHPELPRRLAHFGSVGGRVSISQIRAPQPLRVPRTLGQFRQECAVPQPTNFVPGNSYRLNVSHQNLHWPFSSSRLHSNRIPRPLKAFQRMLGLMASASSVLHLGLLHMQPLQYWLKPRVPSQTPPCQGEPGLRCSSGPYKNHQWMERCVPLGMVYRRKVVSTDASNLGWGALCDSKPAFGLWSKKEGHIHINRLEMLAVCLCLCTFLSDLNGHHVLVQYFYLIWWMYT